MTPDKARSRRQSLFCSQRKPRQNVSAHSPSLALVGTRLIDAVFRALQGLVLEQVSSHLEGLETGGYAFGSTDLNEPVLGYAKQSQVAVGGLIGKSFGGLILQTYLTHDVYEKNYGGHDTRLWGRFIMPLWLPPAAPAPSMMYRKG